MRRFRRAFSTAGTSRDSLSSSGRGLARAAFVLRLIFLHHGLSVTSHTSFSTERIPPDWRFIARISQISANLFSCGAPPLANHLCLPLHTGRPPARGERLGKPRGTLRERSIILLLNDNKNIQPQIEGHGHRRVGRRRGHDLLQVSGKQDVFFQATENNLWLIHVDVESPKKNFALAETRQ